MSDTLSLIIITLIIFALLVLRYFAKDYSGAKNAVYTRLRTLASRINAYIEDHIDEKERAELLNMMKDHYISTDEFRRIILILLSKNANKNNS